MSETNLTQERTTFVGRQRELAELAALLEEGERLVTVYGAPGSGKSRLARQLGQVSLTAFDGGVWVCDLAPARDAEDVALAVADALRVSADEGAAGSADAIGRVLASRRRTLVILDDVERVGQMVAAHVGAWLDAAPRATFLVTSRERLRVEGERCVELLPLPADDALALLVARARLARRDFELRDEDRAAATLIVERLDAIPLALELAAARLAVMSPRTLLGMFDDRFELLRSARRDANARQATLEHAIDLSWELLSDAEKDALARCSVFADGFALAEAMRVLAGDGMGDAPAGGAGGAATLDVLSALVDKSLVRAVEAADASGERRFALYETIREYTARKLEASGNRAGTAARHARTYLSAARRIHDRRWLAAERGNLLAAHVHLLATEPLAAAELLVLLAPLLLQRGPLALLVARLDATIPVATAGAAPALRSALLVARGQASRLRGSAEDALGDLDEAVRLAEEAGGVALANALLASGVAQQSLGRVDVAVLAFERALVLAKAAGERAKVAEAEKRLAVLRADRDDVLKARQSLDASVELVDNIGLLFAQRGSFADARAACERALATQREAKNRRSEGVVTIRLASVCLHAGDAPEALALADRALAIHREVNDRVFEATSLWVRALASQDLGAFADAEESLARAKELALEVRARLVQGYVERAQGELAWEMGDEPAARAHAALAAEQLEVANDRANAGLARAEHAALTARAGKVEDAERELATARALAAGSERHLAAIDLLAGQLDVARAAATTAPSAARVARRQAEERLSCPADSRDARLAARLLRRSLADAGVEPPAPAEPERRVSLVVASKGLWFRIDGGEQVDLVRRRALRLLFWALVEKRVAAPGEPMSLDEMLAAAWPGERILHKAGTARIYTAIRTLRDLGLRDLLVTAGAGYMLALAATIETVESA